MYLRSFDDTYFMAQDVLFNMLPEYKVADKFITLVELNLTLPEKLISKKNINTTGTIP